MLTGGWTADDRSGMAKRPRSNPDLADRLCAAIARLAAGRASRSYALQWFALKRLPWRWSATASSQTAARRRTPSA